MFGLQIFKMTLIAIFLPSIIGSLGKLVGKGYSQFDGQNTGMDSPESIFQRNPSSFHDMPHTLQTSYPFLTAQTNHNDDIYSANSQKNYVTISYNKDQQNALEKSDFFEFHIMPNSTTMLSNYDPFYSPLLSRLDTVFWQLSLANSEEVCREKLICLVYANPAKYAPFSSLISAQLSRNLDELKRPTVDNRETLRFFKYMKAAKEGQSGCNCNNQYLECSKVLDVSAPSMVSTLNDIDKLVKARQLVLENSIM